MIIVDDASSSPLDAQLLDRLEEESKQDGRIKVIRNSVNRGLPGARNVGVRQATGAYVLPLDADDRISATFIELAVQALERQPDFEVVVPTAGYFTRDNEIEEGQFSQYAVFLGNAVSLGLVANRFSGATSLMRRSLFDRYSYNEQLTSYEDWDLYLRLAMAGHRFLVTNSIHCYYRQRPDSMIRQMTRTRHFDLLARMYEALPSLHPGTRLVSVLAPIIELLGEEGGLAHDAALAQLQHEIGDLRGRMAGMPLRYKMADALNHRLKRLPFVHRILKSRLS
jgi:glycosyltransferase involved in cell wall biosynthesis